MFISKEDQRKSGVNKTPVARGREKMLRESEKQIFGIGCSSAPGTKYIGLEDFANA